MSAFGGLILTNKGRNLQAKAQLGTALHFTRIALGDYDIGGESILDLSSLKHEVKSLPIVKLKLLSVGKAVVGAVFSNEDMKSGFYWREIGIFANDPENGEILYCYGNAGTNAEYIPAGGGADIIEKSIDVTAIVGNTTNVTATIDQSLIFASQKDIENKVDKVPGKQLSTEDYTTQEKQKLASLSNYSHPSEHPASMIKMGDGSTVEGKITSHLAENVQQFAGKLDKTDYVRTGGYAVTTGTPTAYAITLNPAPIAYVDGMGVTIKPLLTNTGASTLNVNGLGAKPIKNSDGTELSAGDLVSYGMYSLRYNSTTGNFILVNKGGGSVIKSIQRGYVNSTTTTENITISAVNVNKCIVRICSEGSGTLTTQMPSNLATIKLTSSTNVQILRTGTERNTFYWEVIEFNNVKSKQTGTYAGNGLISISAVNSLKSLLYVSSKTSSTTSFNAAIFAYDFADYTHISIYSGDSATEYEWQLIEFS